MVSSRVKALAIETGLWEADFWRFVGETFSMHKGSGESERERFRFMIKVF